MVSGYLLLRKEEPYGDFFRKRALKVLIPFFVWSVIYMLWKREGFDLPFSMKLVASYLLKIVRGPRENHLWFFYALIGLYLFTPILRVFVARASLRDLIYFCGLWFMVVPVFSFLNCILSPAIADILCWVTCWESFNIPALNCIGWRFCC
jgi:surface polysaccharide O-acyltransferase-like enzyme